MSEETNIVICIAEINRFFKYYHIFCKSPDPDSLREVLSYAYSVNEKLRKQKITDFFSSPHYLAIQALRNYSIHQSELFNIPKALPINSFEKLNSEVSILCLMPLNVIKKVLIGKLRKETQKAINETFIFYKKYVDIYPCIFNFGVTLYFEVKKLNLEITSPEFKNIELAIKFEKENNFNHYIGGKISTIHGDSIDSFFDANLISLSEYIDFHECLPKDENGMTSVVSEIEFTPEEWFHSKSPDECLDILENLILEGKVRETIKGEVHFFECVFKGINIYEQFLIEQFNKFFKKTYGHKQ